jgi:2-polyprenyl-3-methyl-5-hydroxy-6-metoxy-1,4-benzoquinol methylase
MTQYDDIAAEYVANKQENTFREDVEYHTFLHGLLLPALNIKDATTSNLKKALDGYRVLDLGCGGGYLTRESNYQISVMCYSNVDRKNQGRLWLWRSSWS